jgi:hypothetical protein
LRLSQKFGEGIRGWGGAGKGMRFEKQLSLGSIAVICYILTVEDYEKGN